MVRNFYFAGGGTGGHIYPAIAIAERLTELQPDAQIHFFCSNRDIDSKILTNTGYEFTPLPAKGFSLHPKKLIDFVTSFFKSSRIAKEKIAQNADSVIVGMGGFVAAPVCWAGRKLILPVFLLNTDSVPGKANKLIARWADEIFVQFEDTADYFPAKKEKVLVTGCPLRKAFDKPEPGRIKNQLELDPAKKILLVTGASSGSQSINEAIRSNITNLNTFADSWQIVHLAGRANYENVLAGYTGAKIAHRVLDYCDDMPSLLAAADLLIGRSGAVSVAEYAAAAVPAICMPYPHHRDMHQYHNAGQLVEAGAAIIVDDLPEPADRAEWLWEELEALMKDNDKLLEMKNNCRSIAKKDAAVKIAEKLMHISPGN
ncbi:MAG: UDP-N-acetylglucosamine--N-acetylmuramyl-(pentapeptide) pyrophosphoryl-undecaprenol N-acetylglucosamine transferase [Planctomycetota bacterium]